VSVKYRVVNHGTRIVLVALVLSAGAACGNTELIADPGDALSNEGVSVEKMDSELGTTTPRKLSLQLKDDSVDVLRLHTYVTDARGVAVTACQIDSIYRVGPHAVDWPVGTPFTIPLPYSEELPNGLYRQKVLIQTVQHMLDLSFGGSGSTESFEVSADGIAPVIERVPSGHVFMVGTDEMGLPADPCPAFSTYSDRVDIEEAVTLVELDDEWTGTGSIQPVRWRESLNTAEGIVFQTFNDSGVRLRFSASVSAEALAAGVQLDFADAAPVATLSIVPDLYTREGRWFATGGTVAIHPVGDGGVSIELSDLVLGNEPNSAEIRSIKSGRIVGRLLTQASEPH
jgi:hypothetical protein